MPDTSASRSLSDIPLAHLSPAQAIALAGVAAFVVLVLFASRRWNAHLAAGMDEPRRKVNELYRQTVVHSEEPRYGFDGATATIMQDEEAPANYNGGEYALTRYARNPEGEYFMLMFEVNRGVPSLVLAKCMEHHIARYVLGEKYREPPLV